MSVCLYSSLSYPTCKSHISYALFCFHMWPVWLYYIFLHYLINSSILGKELLNTKRMF
jgi:hypothetical protein